MKLLTGLFRLARKRAQTADADTGDFRGRITELVDKKDSLSDDEIGKKVEELKSMCQDLPDSDDKGKLDRFLEDFKSLKEQDGATAKEAAGMVADLFEKLDTEAMKDAPETAEKETETPPDAEQKDGDGKEAEAKDTAGETENAPEAEGAGGNHSLEEIWQYIRKRLSEDSDGKPEEKGKEEEKAESVKDHAPRIPVTMNAESAAPSEGSIGAMFARIKNGGR